MKHERAGELISLASTVVQKCVDDELKHVAVSSCVWYDVVGNVDLKQALLQTALDNDDTWTGAGSGHFLKLLLQHQESSLRYLVINCVAQRWSYQETRITDHEKWLLPFLCKMAVETEHDAECLCAVRKFQFDDHVVRILTNCISLFIEDVSCTYGYDLFSHLFIRYEDQCSRSMVNIIFWSQSVYETV